MVRKVSGPLALAAAAATTVAAAPSATVVIEASHGGAGSGLTNTTITVPLNQRYTDPALQTVSYLFLVGADGADLASITCTPYRNDNLTGSAGLPFTSTSPSYLSTNTVVVGSLFCKSSETTTSNSSSSSSSSSSSISTQSSSTVSSSSTSTPASLSTPTSTETISSVTSPTSSSLTPTSVTPTTTPARRTTSIPPDTSVFVSTVSLTKSTQPAETIVSTRVVPAPSPTNPNSATQDMESSGTSSAPPSLNSDSAAVKAAYGDWRVHGIALAGVGFLAVI